MKTKTPKTMLLSKYAKSRGVDYTTLIQRMQKKQLIAQRPHGAITKITPAGATPLRQAKRWEPTRTAFRSDVVWKRSKSRKYWLWRVGALDAILDLQPREGC